MAEVADTPTSRTLRLLRAEGWQAEVVERWIPQIKRRKDLFGVVDVLALKDGETLAVQATSGPNVASRVDKIAESPLVPAIREAGWRLEVWGFRKNSKGRWMCRRVDCS